ncbi:helix-turn-helix transcriptional regulator [Cryobacterium tagatosivorans]|uniref:MarR family transcriptional regulator n=1 Tax=Cryobacterium tagatosivorans TaxID=1259199 RepID=A0A4R8UAY5_9MICO|nr:helix-turn-helix domain-containing protein [Cryobacterium tagatosivorans]TFB47310.1 MarR family transcriptional regulator [Cryobacterium tagatosivorans]
MCPTRAPSYRTLASLSRITLLDLLQRQGAMTVVDLAAATGLHHNTAREHLHRLIDAGYVTCETEPRDSKGRPRIVYAASTGADHSAGSIREAKVTAALRHAEQVRRMLPVEPACRPSSSLSRQLDALDDHLDDVGFDGRLSDDGLHVHLHDCPFADLVREHPEVCRVHFGLLRGILEQADGPLSAEELHPFAAPNTCTLDLHCSDPAEG